MKDRVAAHAPQMKAALKRFIKTEFYKFTKDELQNLVKTMPKRLRAISTAQGGHIPWLIGNVIVCINKISCLQLGFSLRK